MEKIKEDLRQIVIEMPKCSFSSAKIRAPEVYTTQATIVVVIPEATRIKNACARIGSYLNVPK